MEGSTCIQAGTKGLSPRVRAVKNSPVTSTASTDWPAARRARSPSPAPRAWEIVARKPMPKADTLLPTNQPTVAVEPTAAVAWVPRVPTMAVSIYCTAVCSSCSSMVGQARVSTAGSRDQVNMRLSVRRLVMATLLR